MDLRQFDQIDNLGHSLYERFGKLDILVGNAGFMPDLGPSWLMDPDSWARMLDINLTANARLIRSMDPLLRQSDAGRGIFVTSSVGQQPRPFWGFYGATKAALENLVQSYAMEVEKTSMCINLINPGATATNMRRKAYPGEDPATLKTPDEITDCFVDLASANCDHNGQIVKAQ
jgi:NAD(P)-dependent dehydrogenase (short-subunit alcohol dehydrogenase family)